MQSGDLLSKLGSVHFFELDSKGRSIIRVNPTHVEGDQVHFKISSSNLEKDLKFSVSTELFSQSIQEASDYITKHKKVSPKSYLINEEIISEIHSICTKNNLFMIVENELEGVVVLLDTHGAPTAISQSILLSPKGIEYSGGYMKQKSDSDLIRVNVGLTKVEKVTSEIQDYEVLLFLNRVGYILEVKDSLAHSIQPMEEDLLHRVNMILENSSEFNESLLYTIDSLFHKQKVASVDDMFDDLF